MLSITRPAKAARSTMMRSRHSGDEEGIAAVGGQRQHGTLVVEPVEHPATSPSTRTRAPRRRWRQGGRGCWPLRPIGRRAPPPPRLPTHRCRRPTPRFLVDRATAADCAQRRNSMRQPRRRRAVPGRCRLGRSPTGPCALPPRHARHFAPARTAPPQNGSATSRVGRSAEAGHVGQRPRSRPSTRWTAGSVSTQTSLPNASEELITSCPGAT